MLLALGSLIGKQASRLIKHDDDSSVWALKPFGMAADAADWQLVLTLLATALSFGVADNAIASTATLDLGRIAVPAVRTNGRPRLLSAYHSHRILTFQFLISLPTPTFHMKTIR